MVFTVWMGVVLVGVAAVFGYHLWTGWKTRTVRFPLSILGLQEFERDRSAANFWGIMAADFAIAAAALAMSGFALFNSLIIQSDPVENLRALDGCYEGEGTPDFMRPPVHWVLRLNNGMVVNRAGEKVSQLRLIHETSGKTTVTFSPGIIVSTDEHKSSTVYPGENNAEQEYRRGAVAGEAYTINDRATIRLIDGWGEVLLKTTCG